MRQESEPREREREGREQGEKVKAERAVQCGVQNASRNSRAKLHGARRGAVKKLRKLLAKVYPMKMLERVSCKMAFLEDYLK